MISIILVIKRLFSSIKMNARIKNHEDNEFSVGYDDGFLIFEKCVISQKSEISDCP